MVQFFKLRVLRKQLEDESSEVRSNAVSELATVSADESISELLQAALRDPAWDVRRAALRSMAARPEIDAVPFLIDALDDERLEIRVAAAQDLGRSDDPEAVNPLLKALGDDEAVQTTAIRALGALNHPKALHGLIAALSSDDAFIRATVAHTLGTVLEASSVDPLCRALADDAPQVRRAAAGALGELAPTFPDQQLHLLAATHGDRQQLADLGHPRALSPLMLMLHHRDVQVQRMGIDGLGNLGKAALKPLLRVAGSARALSVQCAAVEAMGAVGDRRAMPTLLGLLGDLKPEIRRAAARGLARLGSRRPELELDRIAVTGGAPSALAECGDRRAVLPLMKLLRSAGEDVQKVAAGGLAALGDEGLRALIGAVDTGTSTMRGVAAAALGAFEDPRVVPVLVELLEDPVMENRPAAISSLAALGELAFEPLVACLEHESIPRRRSAAAALGEMGDPRGIGPLRQALAVAELGTRRTYLEALATLGDTDGLAQLAALEAEAEADAEARRRELTERPLEKLIERLERRPAELAEKLGMTGEDEALEPLMHLLSDRSEARRKAGAKGLAALSRRRPELALRDIADTGGRIELMARKTDARLVPVLLRVLCSQDYGDRWEHPTRNRLFAIQGLANNRGATVAAGLAGALAHESTVDVAEPIIEALTRVSDAACVEGVTAFRARLVAGELSGPEWTELGSRVDALLLGLGAALDGDAPWAAVPSPASDAEPEPPASPPAAPTEPGPREPGTPPAAPPVMETAPPVTEARPEDPSEASQPQEPATGRRRPAAPPRPKR